MQYTSIEFNYIYDVKSSRTNIHARFVLATCPYVFESNLI